MSNTNPEQDKAFLDGAQKPSEQPGEQQSRQANEFLDNLRKQNDEAYARRVIEISDQNEFKIKLNIPDKDGKTETFFIGDEKIVQPIYVGTEEKPYQPHPLTPLEFKLIEKLRRQFDAENKPDMNKIVEHQMELYKFMANRYLRMEDEDFARAHNWVELRTVIDACEYKALRPPKK